MKDKTSKFLNVIKWLSLAFAICFSIVSCAESLLPSKKTSDQVDGLIDDDFINTADYVALKDFQVEVEKPSENNVYYVGQKIDYDVTYSPSNASYKTLNISINNEELVGLDEKTHEIVCLKPGNVEIKFEVLKEEKVGTKTLNFEIKKLHFDKFNIVDEVGNIFNNKDIIFKNVTDKPKYFKIDTDSKIARDKLLTITVADKNIASVTKNGDSIKVTPISEGQTTATLKIDDLIIKLYISTLQININNARLTTFGVLRISKGRDFIFNTLYFNCDDVRAVDHNRLVVDFEENSFFELADYRSGIIIGRNQFFLNIRYKVDRYDEVSAFPEGHKIIEKIKVRYVYPGGTEVVLNRDINGNVHEYFTIEATTIPKLSLDNYSYIPDSVNFGVLINDKGEIYHQDYFQDLVTKTPWNDAKIKDVDYYYPKFEVIEGNPDDLNLSKSTFYRLVISLKEGFIPTSKYVIRFYFNEFDKTKYKDITIHFEKVSKIPEVDTYLDFRNLYGELDKTPSGIIPENHTYSYSLYGSQLAHYEFVDKDRNIIPTFKSGGIILDSSELNNDLYTVFKNFSNESETDEKVEHDKKYYSKDYCYYIQISGRKDLIKDKLKLKFTSPVYDFFGAERKWFEFDVNIDNSPEHMEYKINGKTVQIVESNTNSPIYEYPEELNIGDKLKLTLDGQKSTYIENGIAFDGRDYKFTKSAVYDGVEYPNYKNKKEGCERMPSAFTSLFPLGYSADDPDIANFSDTQIIMKYPGEAVLTFYNGVDYGERYEFEFKLKVKVEGERNPIDVHETKLVNFNEHEYAKNDVENGNIRVGSSIKIDTSMFDQELFNKNVDVEISNPSLLDFDKQNGSIKALRTGQVSIFIRLKDYNHVVEKFDLNITNTTSPFKLQKSDFIDLKEVDGVQSLVGHVKKEYNIKIKPIVETSSKFIKVEEVSDNPILDINQAGVIKTNEGGKTKIKITYGNEELGEQLFEQIVDFEVIDNSAHYNGVVYFTRKFVGHFGLNAAIAVCSSVFLILLFYNKKKLNYLIAPIALTYGGFIACFTELLQNFVPSRFCVLNDMWINFQGCLFGVIFTIIVYVIVILTIKLITKNKENKLKNAQNLDKK